MSRPRSSHPSGCARDGPWRMAEKSMSSRDTGHSHGPAMTARIMKPRTMEPATANRCRRKRRHVSCQGETRFARDAVRALALAVGDTRVEPAIEDICDQVEEDDQAGKHKCDRHHHGRVVPKDRCNEQ